MKQRLQSAQALPESGRLVACDRDPDSLAIARRTWDAAGVGHKVGQHASTAHAQHGCMCLASGMRVIVAVRDHAVCEPSSVTPGS